MAAIPTLYVGAERPGLALHWLDTVGAAVDFSGDPWTFVTTIEQDGTTTTLTGVTVTPNSSPTIDHGLAADVPSLSLEFAAGSLDAVSAGPAVLRIDATLLGRNRKGVWRLVVGT